MVPHFCTFIISYLSRVEARQVIVFSTRIRNSTRSFSQKTGFKGIRIATRIELVGFRPIIWLDKAHVGFQTMVHDCDLGPDITIFMLPKPQCKYYWGCIGCIYPKLSTMSRITMRNYVTTILNSASESYWSGGFISR